jgi:hypothetical protein
LFERLTDLRFLSIDFLNTFLLTYRVFTDGVTVLEALKKVHYSPDTNSNLINAFGSFPATVGAGGNYGESSGGSLDELKPDSSELQMDFEFMRRVSATSSASVEQSIASQSELMYGTHRCSVASGASTDVGALTAANAQLHKQLQQFQQQCVHTNSAHAQHIHPQHSHHHHHTSAAATPSLPHHPPQPPQTPPLTIEQQLLLSRNNQHWRLSYRKFEEDQARERYLRRFGERLAQTDSGGESESGQSGVSGATRSAATNPLTRRRTSNSAPSSRATSVDIPDSIDPLLRLEVQMRRKCRIASICVSAPSAQSDVGLLPSNVAVAVDDEPKAAAQLSLPLRPTNVVKDGGGTTKTTVTEGSTQFLGLIAVGQDALLSPAMATPMPPPPSPVGAMYAGDQQTSRNRIHSSSSAEENDSSCDQELDITSRSTSEMSSSAESGSDQEVESEPEATVESRVAEQQAFQAQLQQYGHWNLFTSNRDSSAPNESGSSAAEPFSSLNNGKVDAGTDRMPRSQVIQELMSHSNSQDTLKADNQSGPNSPTVLSSATSSATLVGSVDSKCPTPKRSPVSKHAPIAISPLTKNFGEPTQPPPLLPPTPPPMSTLTGTPKKAPAVPPRTKPPPSRPTSAVEPTSTPPPPPPPARSDCESPNMLSDPFLSGASVIRRHSTADANSGSVRLVDRTCASARNSIISGQSAPTTGSSNRTSIASVGAPGTTGALICTGQIGAGLTASQPAINQIGSQHRLSCASSASSNYLRVRGAGSKRGSGDSQLESGSARNSFQTDSSLLASARSSFQHSDASQLICSKAGVVVTSSRASTRRSSTASAASAFAVATAASSNPVEPMSGVISGMPVSSNQMYASGASRASSRLPSIVSTDLKYAYSSTGTTSLGGSTMTPSSNANLSCPGGSGPAGAGAGGSGGSGGSSRMNNKRESVISTAATMRVLNVLRHWISKHSQDFENDLKLLQMTSEFLEELVHNPNLLPAEHKAACQLLQMISKDKEEQEHESKSGAQSAGTSVNVSARKLNLDILLFPPPQVIRQSIETLSALEIAENMTFIDHHIFVKILSSEFLCQAWMKPDKAIKAPHILLMTRRFNEMSKLVISEIVEAQDLARRVAIIEKWAAVADICRCLHNFNGVLQICSAFTNSSVFRLKRTWDKVNKTVSNLFTFNHHFDLCL